MRVCSFRRENLEVLNNHLTRKEQLILLFVAGALLTGSTVWYAHRDKSAALPVDASVITPIPDEEPPPPVDVPQPDTAVALPVVDDTAPPPVPQRVPLRVAVRGAVYSPDLYTFYSDEDPRVQDLLDAAGGLEDYADASDINVAARLIDGTTLTVPGHPPERGTQTVIHARSETPMHPPNPPQYTVSGWRQEAAPTPSPNRSDRETQGSTTEPSDGLLDLNTATQAELETLPGIGPVFASRIIEYRKQTPFRSVDELTNIKGIAEKRLADIRHLVTVR